MSTTLEILVLHPHPDPVTGEWRNPGDLVNWTQAEFAVRQQQATHDRYYHVQKGEVTREPEATRVSGDETIPDGSPIAAALRIAAAESELEKIEKVFTPGGLPDDPNPPQFNDITAPTENMTPEPTALEAPVPGAMEPKGAGEVLKTVTTVVVQPPMEPTNQLPTNEPAEPVALGADGTGDAKMDLPTNEPPADQQGGLDEVEVTKAETATEVTTEAEAVAEEAATQDNPTTEEPTDPAATKPKRASKTKAAE